MAFSIEFVDKDLNGRVRKTIDRAVQKIGRELLDEIKTRTPVDTGTAKAGWRKQASTTGFVLENNVPYIGILDRGRHMTNRGMRGSKQAPRGIVGPSLKAIKGRN
jgi:hypothetical protein